MPVFVSEIIFNRSSSQVWNPLQFVKICKLALGYFSLRNIKSSFSFGYNKGSPPFRVMLSMCNGVSKSFFISSKS